MQDRFKLFRRGVVFYCQDRSTGQQKSLQTRDKAEARRIIQAKNDTITQPLMNLVMARTYLVRARPENDHPHLGGRDGVFCDRSNDNTRMRHERVVRTKPMQFLKCKRLIETTADDFFEALKLGTNSTIAFLQTLHNDALGMGWIPAPILPRKMWPKMKKKEKRAITEAEHITLMAAVDDGMASVFSIALVHRRERRPTRANLTIANIDWKNRVLTYSARN